MLRGGGGSLLLKLKSLFLHKKEAVPSLPDELYHEIFIRLPAKSTFTCKCVSKTWFSIISNPDFVKLHLNHTLKFNKDSSFIVGGYDMNIRKYLMYNITKHSVFSTRNFFGTDHVMEHPQPTFPGDTLGSCNGLVFLQLCHPKIKYFFILWNPDTKEYKRVPDSRARCPAHFYYDCKNDDYKIVSASNTPSFSVDVYSLRSNSWRCIQAKNYSLDGLLGVLVNGSLHWITNTPTIIVSFDISDESFKEIQLPGELNEKMCYLGVLLKVLEGCLCVVHSLLNEAWVMREYGVWESWTKHRNKTVSKYRNLMWSSENGECLIYRYSEDMYTDLIFYDLKHSIARPISFGSFDIKGVHNYIETLVLLDTGAYLGRTKVT